MESRLHIRQFIQKLDLQHGPSLKGLTARTVPGNWQVYKSEVVIKGCAQLASNALWEHSGGAILYEWGEPESNRPYQNKCEISFFISSLF